jgi:hypothetical protein
VISWRDRAKSDLDCEPLFFRANDPFSGDKLIAEVLKRLNGGNLEKGARVVQLFNARSSGMARSLEVRNSRAVSSNANGIALVQGGRTEREKRAGR